MTVGDDARQAERERLDSERENAKARAERASQWRELLTQVGRRYENALLHNFEVSCDSQQQVVDALREFGNSINVAIESGRNLVLFGPRGTGKDHLLVAMMRAAIVVGRRVVFRDGQTLYAEARDGITKQVDESQFITRFTMADVFAVSDPTPPIGDVRSDWQLSTLFRIIDRRYRDMKPTWVTINAESAAEAEKRLAPNIVDRLTDGALVLRCEWPSYRTSHARKASIA